MSRSQTALIHRGPQAMTPLALGATLHAPNAALLIDFDNVTMGIRSDLGNELRNLLSSDIIKGKVAVQRAYADWRRYPQYIVPLSEASIDLIFAPAYGSSKKNATDIRLAIDALELVFTRSEIGTFILLSGDSDFSSLVIKLKEYGKYVIGVGIRESSSDLLVQNCDEYYSYNALAGLVKASEDEPARKYDPWELVTEAVTRMKRNGDVMRSDRLKQVMQEIDSSFDEKNLGISKFSRFCQEAAQRGLLSVTKLENGQLEIDLPSTAKTETRALVPADEPPLSMRTTGERPAEAPGEERSRRGRRGRGRGRGGAAAAAATAAGGGAAAPAEREPRVVRDTAVAASGGAAGQLEFAEPAPAASSAAAQFAPSPSSAAFVTPQLDPIGVSGERLTRGEAFDLVRRAIESLTVGEDAVRASELRDRARRLLGRDSESLNDRMFTRILRDAHDADVIDLRRRGDDFEVARAATPAPVAEQLARAAEATAPSVTPASSGPAMAPRLGMGPRGGGGRSRGRGAAPPPELFAVGVIEEVRPPSIEAVELAPAVTGRGQDNGAAPPTAEQPAGRKRAPRKAAGAPRHPARAHAGLDATTSAITRDKRDDGEPPSAPKGRRAKAVGAKESPRRGRPRKPAKKGTDE
jgi:uncharacterized protein (TIGR00288 family)